MDVDVPGRGWPGGGARFVVERSVQGVWFDRGRGRGGCLFRWPPEFRFLTEIGIRGCGAGGGGGRRHGAAGEAAIRARLKVWPGLRV